MSINCTREVIRALRRSSCYLLLLLPLTTAYAQNTCEEARREVEVGSSLASAGTFANLARRPGSLNAETNRLLSEAAEKTKTAEPPSGLCPEGCLASKSPQIIFSSIPNRYLEQYRDKQRCAELLAQTERSPIRYQDREFPSREEFEDWFYELSTGSGEDGEDLYRRCPGSCSPRYLVTIDQTEKRTYLVDAEVICGHARDKSDNQYRLETSYRWSCTANSD